MITITILKFFIVDEMFFSIILKRLVLFLFLS